MSSTCGCDVDGSSYFNVLDTSDLASRSGLTPCFILKNLFSESVSCNWLIAILCSSQRHDFLNCFFSHGRKGKCGHAQLAFCFGAVFIYWNPPSFILFLLTATLHYIGKSFFFFSCY